MTVTLYEVGGCVRDDLLGVSSKDIDYTAVTGSYQELLDYLDQDGFDRFLPLDEEDEGEASKKCRDMFTARAKFPKGMTRFAGRDVTGLAADFVLARKESTYSDGRHPDEVQMGTLEDDLRRRDFTVNAIAKDSSGNLIDPFDGQGDLDKMLLRAVGSAEDRLREDALRALRAIRFKITKGFYFDSDLMLALHSEWLPPLLASVSVERRQQELLKAFRHDTLGTMELLSHELSPEFLEATFTDGLWLKPTLEQ
jgi:tRNA nucleotidyltransferase/poly(A) polymerase